MRIFQLYSIDYSLTPSVKSPCLICQKPIYHFASAKKHHCSHDKICGLGNCLRCSQKEFNWPNCETCGKAIYIRIKEHRRFCSRTCIQNNLPLTINKSVKAPKLKNCTFCKKKFEVIKNSNFCSDICRGLMKKRRQGKYHRTKMNKMYREISL